ncbi:unnamed protein product [Camellia sinensis]
MSPQSPVGKKKLRTREFTFSHAMALQKNYNRNAQFVYKLGGTRTGIGSGTRTGIGSGIGTYGGVVFSIDHHNDMNTTQEMP